MYCYCRNCDGDKWITYWEFFHGDYGGTGAFHIDENVNYYDQTVACRKRYIQNRNQIYKKILQWAVIILGFSLNLGTIAKMGGQSLPVIISTISTSLIVAFIMMKVLKMDGKVSCLIGVGSSICGCSAVAATAPVIEADDEAVASTAEGLYGVEGILFSAVTVKLVRTLAIIPITLVLALYRIYQSKKDGTQAGEFSFKKIFPWFILYFIAAAITTTIVGILPEKAFTVFYTGTFVKAMKWLAKFFIAMAMCVPFL